MENIKILVPLDFSELGSKALHSAERLAKLFNGSITPFHSYLPLNEVDGGPYMFGMGSTTVEDYDEIEETLQNIGDDMEEAGIESEYAIKKKINEIQGKNNSLKLKLNELSDKTGDDAEDLAKEISEEYQEIKDLLKNN